MNFIKCRNLVILIKGLCGDAMTIAPETQHLPINVCGFDSHSSERIKKIEPVVEVVLRKLLLVAVV